MKQNRHYWIRVKDGVVTHIIWDTQDWPERNPWPLLPGQWIEGSAAVTLGQIYDAETNTFLDPPAD